MAHQQDDSVLDIIVQLLIENRSDVLADSFRILLNEAMMARAALRVCRTSPRTKNTAAPPPTVSRTRSPSASGNGRRKHRDSDGPDRLDIEAPRPLPARASRQRPQPDGKTQHCPLGRLGGKQG